jgi:hypothetical protein
MASKEIQQLAIKRTNEEIGVNAKIDWGRELPQMETLILGHLANPFGEFQSGAAQQLLHRIAHTGEFMLTLVFNQDYSKVVALPMPEIFEGNTRIQLATSIIKVRENMHDIIFVIEEELANHPTSGTSNRIIVVEQNMNEFGNKHVCDKNPLLIGTWNFRIAQLHNQAKPYDNWVNAISYELNGTGTPSKKRKNAV